MSRELSSDEIEGYFELSTVHFRPLVGSPGSWLVLWPETFEGVTISVLLLTPVSYTPPPGERAFQLTGERSDEPRARLPQFTHHLPKTMPEPSVVFLNRPDRRLDRQPCLSARRTRSRRSCRSNSTSPSWPLSTTPRFGSRGPARAMPPRRSRERREQASRTQTHRLPLLSPGGGRRLPPSHNARGEHRRAGLGLVRREEGRDHGTAHGSRR